MIRKGFRTEPAQSQDDTQGFDAFDLRLGDLMRGERATMGKSLLDVQRELRIKAAYIAAIENADPTAFDTPGFIAGYVRSYARYLNLDPDWAFERFCRESGFSTTHGMSEEASGVKVRERAQVRTDGDMFSAPATPFVPAREAMFSQVEPRAIGSVMVLVALIGGLGYGGWTVLQEVQKVQLAPVENTPTVMADMDPLAGAGRPGAQDDDDAMAGGGGPEPGALDRLYRPQALEAPVMVARDAPISTLDPRAMGALVVPEASRDSPDPTTMDLADAAEVVAEADEGGAELPDSSVQVTQDPLPGVTLVAVRPAWVRVRGADGAVLYEGILNAGDTYDVPRTEVAPTMRIGESGAVYFAVEGDHYGPVGPRGAVSSDVALSTEAVREGYEVADLSSHSDLAAVVDVAELQSGETGESGDR
ncbi:helix-turn-helix domain-containing protein [Salibaculum halophilum]|uniref:helix-turn-helix domain-containing protein n=1 Tax=Salibaculum halophilum TaxID=1914408 RepID=UPI000A1124F9|nr:helix-turn-helix domain-containing protein [Salibaculum halophilum]